MSIKMNNFKTFYECERVIYLKEIIQPPPDESFLRLSNKNVWTGIYRDIQTFAFQVLWECSSWASRNGAVQMFFLTQPKIMFLAVFWEYIFYNAEWVVVCKMIRGFWVKLYCKMSDLSSQFCWLWFWDVLPENLKLIGKLQIWGFFFLVQISFLGHLGHFNQYNFKIFSRWPTMVADIFTQTAPHHKKAY